ncbi:MAG: protein kinase domain-containing protein, partial [Candidatus Sumerlaeota bacterium]
MDEKNAFLNKYEIIRQLGAGGMAKVYLARDKRLDRLVALKTIHAPEGLIASDSEATQIFQRVRREAQAIARLNHHNIVTIFDVYLPSDKSSQAIYLALEYIDGKTLDQAFGIRKDHAVGEGETLRIGVELAKALSYAHSRGICHRDIKPANIMREDDTGRMVLLDFSLAYNLASSTHTLTSTPIGTPAYMSPEQILTPTQVDHRTDVYSLGLVLYYMMAGVPPFQGDSYFKLCDQQIGELPEPLRNRRPEISELAERAIFLAISKKPDERIQSANQMADLLEGILKLQEEKKRFEVEPTEEQIQSLFAAATEKDVFVPPEIEVPPQADASDSKVTLIDAPQADATLAAKDISTQVEQQAQAEPSPTTLDAQEPAPTSLGQAPEANADATRIEKESPGTGGTARPPSNAEPPVEAAEPDEDKDNKAAFLAVAVIVAILALAGASAYFMLFAGDKDSPDAPGPVAQTTPTPSPTPQSMARTTPTPTPEPSPTPAVTPEITRTPRPTPTLTPTPQQTASTAKMTLAFRKIPERQLDWKASRNFAVEYMGQSDAAAIVNYEYRLDEKSWQITKNTQLEFAELSAGPHRLEIVAVDTAGNRSEPLKHRFSVTNKIPSIKWSKAPSPDSTVRVPPAQELIVSANDPDGTITACRFGIDSDTPGINSTEP